MTLHRNTDVTLQVCTCCGGEGRIYHAGHGATSRGGNLYWDDWSEPCKECEGTGGALIPCELIELEDLDCLPPPPVSA